MTTKQDFQKEVRFWAKDTNYASYFRVHGRLLAADAELTRKFEAIASAIDNVTAYCKARCEHTDTPPAKAST